MDTHLPTDSGERKDLPLATGVLDYFPDALAEVARLSKIGNDKHNPGEPLHWSRGKSTDHADCIMRHLLERGTVDTDGVLHDAKVAWRALAQLQVTLEQRRAPTTVVAPEPRPFSYWYVATPYTRFPAGLVAAHLLACRLTALLMQAGVPCYSPIAHTHPIADHGQLDAVDHDFWVRIDKPMLDNAGGLLVVTAESWKQSRGVAHEIEEFYKAGKPVVFWDPATEIPAELIDERGAHRRGRAQAEGLCRGPRHPLSGLVDQ